MPKTNKSVPVGENRPAARTVEAFGPSPGRGSESEADLAGAQPQVEGELQEEAGMAEKTGQTQQVFAVGTGGISAESLLLLGTPTPKRQHRDTA